jgi:disulfide bond formation protein DsbB
MKLLRKHALYFAWVIALVALLASLYYSEVLGMEPCRLCWYQRIGMFPLALFLGIAAYKNEKKIAHYSLPLVAFGGFFALYQSLMQLFPVLQNSPLCGHAAHCTLPGPAPFLSLLGFGAIAFLILLGNHRKR